MWTIIRGSHYQKLLEKTVFFFLINQNDKIYLGSGLLGSHRLKDHESLICMLEFKSNSLLGERGRAYAGGLDVACLSSRSLITAAAGTKLKAES